MRFKVNLQTVSPSLSNQGLNPSPFWLFVVFAHPAGTDNQPIEHLEVLKGEFFQKWFTGQEFDLSRDLGKGFFRRS
jgi:hypothetical protein